MSNGVRIGFSGSVTIPMELCGGSDETAQEVFKSVLDSICGVYDDYFVGDAENESNCLVWVSEEIE